MFKKIKKFLINYFIVLIEKLISASKPRSIKLLMDDGVIKVGHHTYGLENSRVDIYKGSEAKIIIGNYCSISKDVVFITGGIHPMDRVSTYPFHIRFKLDGRYINGMPFTKGDIIIGNDVWIGTNVTILSGVKIGDGAVIATNSIVTKDLPPYSIVGGNPARIIRFRFSQDIIDDLLRIKWWDWSDEKVIESVTQLFSQDIKEFINKHK